MAAGLESLDLGAVPTEHTATERALCCESCGTAIAKADELLMDRAAIMDSACFAYELDVLNQEVWAYSATNPGATRFDVIRLAPAPSVVLTGRPTAEHSWFPPYLWRMAECYGCGEHLGWSFFAADANGGGTDDDVSTDADEQLSFHGLIVTRLRERLVRTAQLQDRARMHAERGQIDAMVRSMFEQAAERAGQAADGTQTIQQHVSALAGSVESLIAHEAHSPAREAPALYLRSSESTDHGSALAVERAEQ